jgi:hypothetical protein
VRAAALPVWAAVLVLVCGCRRGMKRPHSKQSTQAEQARLRRALPGPARHETATGQCQRAQGGRSPCQLAPGRGSRPCAAASARVPPWRERSRAGARRCPGPARQPFQRTRPAPLSRSWGTRCPVYAPGRMGGPLRLTSLPHGAVALACVAGAIWCLMRSCLPSHRLAARLLTVKRVLKDMKIAMKSEMPSATQGAMLASAIEEQQVEEEDMYEESYFRSASLAALASLQSSIPCRCAQ